MGADFESLDRLLGLGTESLSGPVALLFGKAASFERAFPVEAFLPPLASLTLFAGVFFADWPADFFAVFLEAFFAAVCGPAFLAVFVTAFFTVFFATFFFALVVFFFGMMEWLRVGS